MPARRVDAALARVSDRVRLAFRAVDAEAEARGQRLRAAGDQTVDSGAHGCVVLRAGKLERRCKRNPRCERHRREVHLPPSRPRQAIEQSQNADLSEVAFQERIGRLRRRVRDECYRAGIDARAVEQSLDAGDDSLGNAARSVVRRRDLDARDECARRRIDGDHVGKRSTDVDPDAQTLRRRACHQVKPAVTTCVTIRIVTLPPRSYWSKSACRSRRSASARSPEAGRYEDEAARPDQPFTVERLIEAGGGASDSCAGKARKRLEPARPQRLGIVGSVGAHDLTIGFGERIAFVALVLQERNAPARDPRKLEHRLRRRKPVKGLTDHDEVDALVGKAGLLRGSFAPLDVGVRLGLRTHALVWLDGDDLCAALCEEARRDSRARADVGDRQRGGIAEAVQRRVDRFGRIGRAKGGVALRARAEAPRRIVLIVHRQPAGRTVVRGSRRPFAPSGRLQTYADCRRRRTAACDTCHKATNPYRRSC